LKAIVLLLFSISSMAQVCSGVQFDFDYIEGEEIASKQCVSGKTRKLKKDKVCKCQKNNRLLDIKESENFKKAKKDSSIKIVKHIIDSFETNMSITLNDMYSVSQFSSEPLGDKCNISRLEEINKRCGKNSQKLLGQAFPGEDILLKTKEKIENERLIRISGENLKLPSFLDRENSKCGIPETKGYLATGQKGLLFIDKIVENYKDDIQKTQSSTLSEFISKNLNEIAEQEGMTSGELSYLFNSIKTNPLFKNLLKSNELASNPFVNMVNIEIEKTLLDLKKACKDSFDILEKVLCEDSSTQISMGIEFYKEMGLSDSKDNLDLELDNLALSELMCAQNGQKIPTLIDTLDQVHFKQEGTDANISTNKVASNNYNAQIKDPMNNICKYYPDIERGLSNERCGKRSLKPICLDLSTYGALNLIPKTIAKKDENGNIVEDDSGNTLQIPNPDYISSKDIDSAIFGKGSLVDSFFVDPKDKETSKTAESSTDSSSSSPISAGSIGNKTDKRQALNTTAQQSQKVSSNKFPTSFGLGGNSSDKSVAEGNKRIYDKLKGLVDSYASGSTATSSRSSRSSSSPSRSLASTNTPQPAPTNNPFYAGAPTNSGISASNTEEEYEQDSPYDEKKSAIRNRSIASSLGTSPFVGEDGNDPTDNINKATGKRNNGINLSSEESPYGDIPVIELYGNIEEEFLNIDPENMIKLDESQIKAIETIQKLIKKRKPFYISKRRSPNVRVLLVYNKIEGKYEVEKTYKEKYKTESINNQELNQFKQNINNSLDKGVLKKIAAFTIEAK